MSVSRKTPWLELKIPPAVQMVLAGALIWVIAQNTPPLDLPPSFGLWASRLLAAAGVTVAVSGILSFIHARTTADPRTPGKAARLVSGGIYRFTRNPMYLGMLLILSAWSVKLQSLYSLPVLALFVLYMNRYQIQAEERALEDRFGAEFSEYRSRVRRWL